MQGNTTILRLLSNQCFELWYLLHYHYSNIAISRKQYFSKLNKLLGFEYKKNEKDLYAKLLTPQGTAIKNAKKLRKEYDTDSPYKNNPSTTVYVLVEELKKYSP